MLAKAEAYQAREDAGETDFSDVEYTLEERKIILQPVKPVYNGFKNNIESDVMHLCTLNLQLTL